MESLIGVARAQEPAADLQVVRQRDEDHPVQWLTMRVALLFLALPATLLAVLEARHEPTQRSANLEVTSNEAPSLRSTLLAEPLLEATRLSLERLEGLGLFRLESLSEYKVVLETPRAEVNEDLIDTLHEYEMEESAALIECNAIGRSCAEILMMSFFGST